MQIIRIYHARGGLAFAFKPLLASAQAQAEFAERYPEGKGFLWLR